MTKGFDQTQRLNNTTPYYQLKIPFMKTSSIKGFQELLRKWHFIAGLLTMFLFSNSAFSQLVEFNSPQPHIPAYQACTDMQTLSADVYLKLLGFAPGDTNTAQFKVIDNGTEVKVETVHYSTSDTLVARHLTYTPNGGSGDHHIVVTMTTDINGTTYADQKEYDLSFGPQTCVTITGKVARAADANCTLDPGDIGIPNVKVDIYEGTVSTDANGDYILHYPKNQTKGIGTASIVFDPNNQKYYQSDCPSGTGTTITTDADQVVNFMYNKEKDSATTTVDYSVYAQAPYDEAQFCSSSPQQITISHNTYIQGLPNGTGNAIIHILDNGTPLPDQNTQVYDGSNGFQTSLLLSPGNHTLEFTLVVNNGTENIERHSTTNVEFGSQRCKTVTGRVVFDADASCTVNTGDTRLQGVSVSMPYTAISTTTNANGEYSLLVRDDRQGTITAPGLVSNGAGKYYGSDCPDGTAYYLTSTGPYQHDFVYNKNNQSSDVKNGYIYAYGNSDPCLLPASYSFYVGFTTSIFPYTVRVNFGDGNVYEQVINTQYDTVYVSHEYHTAGTFNVRAEAVFSDTTGYAYLSDPIYLSGDCGDVEGFVFEDLNSNCQKDGNEPAYSQYVVYLKAGLRESYVWPDASTGHYSFKVPTGQAYTVKLADADAQGKIRSWWYSTPGFVSCPAKYDGTTAQSGLNFGLNCSAGNVDYSVDGYAWRFRPGFEGVIYFNARNFGCTEGPATVKLELNGQETYNSASTPPTRINGNVLEWDFSNLSVKHAESVYVYVQLSQTAVIGDTVCHNLSISPTAGDPSPEDNEREICSEIRGSWDPNDKQVFIAGTARSGAEMKATDALSYMIRFQNTGTDTAFNIYLLDTIDENLDLRTFQLISTSHQVTPLIGTDRIIRFEYNNIMLPDDKTNEERSHGHVMYTIRPKEGLVPGDKIKNTAYIYFDFNEAVITNTVESEVKDASGVGEILKTASFSCYPNPASSQLNLKLKDGADKGSYKMIDMLGKVALSGELNASNDINISELRSGIYMVQVEVKGVVSTVKLVVAH